MNREIDAIIERALPEGVWNFLLDTGGLTLTPEGLRAVAEAAYEKGGCDALDIAIQAGPSVTEEARRALARELLDLDAKNIEELSADPVWGEKSIVDQVYAQHRRMADKLREVAEGGGGE